MNSLKIIALIVVIFVSATAYADEIPKMITDGFNTYKKSGYESAFNVWLKDSPIENDKTTMMNLKGSFTQIETMYGKIIGYEILKSVKLSSSTIRIYAEIPYEKGPLFMYIDCYKSQKGWIVPIMRFHTEAENILPDDVFSKK